MLEKKIEMEHGDLPGQPMWAMPAAVPGLVASGWIPVEEKVAAERDESRAKARIAEAQGASDAARETQKRAPLGDVSTPEPVVEPDPPKPPKKNPGPAPAPQGPDPDPSAGTAGTKE